MVLLSRLFYNMVYITASYTRRTHCTIL